MLSCIFPYKSFAFFKMVIKRLKSSIAKPSRGVCLSTKFTKGKGFSSRRSPPVCPPREGKSLYLRRKWKVFMKGTIFILCIKGSCGTKDVLPANSLHLITNNLYWYFDAPCTNFVPLWEANDGPLPLVYNSFSTLLFVCIKYFNFSWWKRSITKRPKVSFKIMLLWWQYFFFLYLF